MGLTSAAMRCALGHRQPGERLVEQQDARARRERQPHVEQALAAIGERGGLGALDAGEPEEADQLGGFGGDIGERWPWSATPRSDARCAPARRAAGSPAPRGPPNRLVIWNERPTPAAVMSSGLRPAIERPSSVMVPRSGG